MAGNKKIEAAGGSRTTKILLDEPSTGPGANVVRTAQALSRIIEDSSPRFSIGLFGGWGSGKTTLMQAIQRELPDSVVKVEFNAWRFEREPQLLVPLLDTVRAALITWSRSRDPDTKDRVTRVARRVGRVIRGLAMGASGEVGVPGTAKFSFDVGKAINALTSDDPDQPQSLYVAAFHELSAAFDEFRGSGATRVVVFVDDLDRCLPANALEVLESMKLFFDLPGFVFVVGLDEAVVQRAVRSRFAEATASERPPFPVGHDGAASRTEARLERDYVEKIFQVPYRLPPMLAEQLEGLLAAMYGEADLPKEQLDDFRARVTPHLERVAIERRINPREVKRYLNTYTLQTLIRPELERETVLALQTLLFRYDWRDLYDAILTDSMLFLDALRRYRENENSAFEDLAADLRALPSELSDYLRSPLVDPLCRHVSLDTYMSSLESAGPIPTWLAEAYRSIGRLRSEIRRLGVPGQPVEAERVRFAGSVRETTSQLRGLRSFMTEARGSSIDRLLVELEDEGARLEIGAPDVPGRREVTQELVGAVTARVSELATQLYREFRALRELPMP